MKFSRKKLPAPSLITLPLLFVASALLSHCNVRQSDLDVLRSQNDSLTNAIKEKDAELKQYKQSNVRIRNSAINQLTSGFTQETYDVYISYPNNYQDSGKKYPVLVVLDAEVNFGAVNYIAQRLTKDNLMPEIFIVGIAYPGETDDDTYYSLRCRDFTPTVDKRFEQAHKNYRSGSGGAENFVSFLSLELFPFLNANYPIQEEGRSIYGHSFGGLFGFHVLLNHPDLFENYLLLSPSLWWDQRKLLKSVRADPSVASKGLRLYVSTGALEGNMVADHLEMVNKLKHLYPDRIVINSEILDRETHRTIFGRGVTNGLRFFYARSKAN
jgi:uncharacterized protein